jgi:hypothetical protein
MRNKNFRANLAQKTNPKRTHFHNTPPKNYFQAPSKTGMVANYGFSVTQSVTAGRGQSRLVAAF